MIGWLPVTVAVKCIVVPSTTGLSLVRLVISTGMHGTVNVTGMVICGRAGSLLETMSVVV